MNYFGLWFLIALLVMLFEILFSGTFFCLCIAIGALCSSILSFFDLSMELQLIIFFFFSLSSFALLLKFFLRKSSTWANQNSLNTNLDSIINSSATILSWNQETNSGLVKVGQEIWSAISERNDSCFEIKETATVRAIIGNRVVIKKQD